MRSLGRHWFCQQGELGLFRCPSGRVIVLCDECDVIYLDPRMLSNGGAGQQGMVLSALPECHGGRYATDHELKVAGLDDLGAHVPDE